MKKLAFSLLTLAMLIGTAFVVPTKSASAWVDGVGRVDDISSWIVLDGLFGRGINDVGVDGVGGIGGPFTNPIASWIVLDGLFGRGINDVGVDGVGGIGGPFTNPIASWIVLDGLFSPGVDCRL